MATKRKISVLREEVQLSLDLTALLAEEPVHVPTARVLPFPAPGTDSDANARRRSPKANPPAAEAEPSVFWSEQDILALREELLHHSLGQLGDSRTSEATRAEIREWVDSDEVGPFSFVVCAGACGYCHHDVRERLYSLLKLLQM